MRVAELAETTSNNPPSIGLPASVRKILRSTWMIYALLLLAGLLRFSDLGSKSMWVDEAKGVNENVGALKDITFRCQNGHTAPLREYILHFLVQGPRNTYEAASRTPSAIAGTLMIPLAFALGSLLFGRIAGLCAALFLLASPLQVMHSQDSRMHIVLAYLSMLALYALCRQLYRRESIAGWALAGVAAVTCAYFSYLSVFPLAALVFIGLWDLLLMLRRGAGRERVLRRLKGMGVAASVFLLLYSPWMASSFGAFSRQIGHKFFAAAVENGIAPSQTAVAKPVAPVSAPPAMPPSPPTPYQNRFNFPYFVDLLEMLGGEYKACATISGILALAGLVGLLLKRRSRLILPLAWGASALPLFVLKSGPVYFPQRYLLFYLAMYALLAGCGAAYIVRLLSRTSFLRHRYWRLAWLIGLVMAPLLVANAFGLTHYYRSEKQDWRGAMEFIENRIQTGDVLLMGDHWVPFGVISYRNPRLGKWYRLSPDALTLETFMNEINSVEGTGADVWYVYWAQLPEFIRNVVQREMVEVKVFPGLNGDIHVMKKKSEAR